MASTFFNPTRLTLARKRRGLTKATLAHKLDLSTRMLTAYEAGEKAPSQKTLPRVSEVLGFPVEFFHAADIEDPPLDGSSFRALSTLTAKLRDRVLASGALAMALSDWIYDRFELPGPDVPRYSDVDPETAAMGVRSEWNLGERPICNLLHRLEAQGIRVFSLAEDAVEMDAFSFWRGDVPYVFLNTMKSGERSRIDAAHELGHLVLHWKGGAQGREAEREAALFGAAFLMPRSSVVAGAPRGGRLDRIIDAKKQWGVSAAGLTVRMRKLGLLTEWQYRTLFIEINRKGYRTAEPEGIAAETSQALAKVFSALRDEGVTMAKVAKELHIYPAELHRMVFGLVLTPMEPSGSIPAII